MRLHALIITITAVFSCAWSFGRGTAEIDAVSDCLRSMASPRDLRPDADWGDCVAAIRVARVEPASRGRVVTELAKILENRVCSRQARVESFEMLFSDVNGEEAVRVVMALGIVSEEARWPRVARATDDRSTSRPYADDAATILNCLTRDRMATIDSLLTDHAGWLRLLLTIISEDCYCGMSTKAAALDAILDSRAQLADRRSTLMKYVAGQPTGPVEAVVAEQLDSDELKGELLSIVQAAARRNEFHFGAFSVLAELGFQPARAELVRAKEIVGEGATPRSYYNSFLWKLEFQASDIELLRGIRNPNRPMASENVYASAFCARRALAKSIDRDIVKGAALDFMSTLPSGDRATDAMRAMAKREFRKLGVLADGDLPEVENLPLEIRLVGCG